MFVTRAVHSKAESPKLRRHNQASVVVYTQGCSRAFGMDEAGNRDLVLRFHFQFHFHYATRQIQQTDSFGIQLQSRLHCRPLQRLHHTSVLPFFSVLPIRVFLRSLSGVHSYIDKEIQCVVSTIEQQRKYRFE